MKLNYRIVNNVSNHIVFAQKKRLIIFALIMPQNCAFVNCRYSRTSPEITLCKILTVNLSDFEYSAKIKASARISWKSVIHRTREVTKELRERFIKGNVFLCEKHFDLLLIQEFTNVDQFENKNSENVTDRCDSRSQFTAENVR